MNRTTFITVFAALIVGFLLNSFFIVNEKEEAIVFEGLYSAVIFFNLSYNIFVH
jgi:hypothetical protein